MLSANKSHNPAFPFEFEMYSILAEDLSTEFENERWFIVHDFLIRH